jgi:hypothetical protein
MKHTLLIAAAMLLIPSLIRAEEFRDVKYLYKAEGEDKGEEIDGANLLTS